MYKSGRSTKTSVNVTKIFRLDILDGLDLEVEPNQAEDETFQILDQVVKHTESFRIPEMKQNSSSSAPPDHNTWTVTLFPSETHFDWLTSIKEPILEVVNEMCSSPMTISNSWKQTQSQVKETCNKSNFSNAWSVLLKKW